MGVAVLLAFVAGCYDGGADKFVAGAVDPDDHLAGPSIVYDPLAKPVPEVPFPTDLLLTPSEDTASGVAWNISTEEAAHHEVRVRTMLNGLDGFGTFAPIFLPFSGPLDLGTVTDESVILLNVEPGHPEEGHRIPLDLGRGHFPAHGKAKRFWPHDPLGGVDDLLLPPDNVADVDGDGIEEPVRHYEVATHTLILRPLRPLAPGARHGVLVTRQMKGWAAGADVQSASAPVRSPFPFKSHAAEADLVRGARQLAGLDEADLAFGWTYTTSVMARPLLTIRDGLYGKGPLAHLAEAFPAGIADVHDSSVEVDGDLDGDGKTDVPGDHRRIVQANFVAEIFAIVGAVQPGFGLTYDYVDYLVFGTFATPDVRTGEARTLGVDTMTGEGEVGTNQVPFTLAVPRETEQHHPPFPVMLYFHGTSTSRMEVLAVADAMARQGIASLAFDQVGHGPIIPDILLLLEREGIDPSIIEDLAPALADILVPDKAHEFVGLTYLEALDKLGEIGFWRELAHIGRTTDENGDGALESGESFFFADPFRMCASFWQDLVDFFQIVRTVRSFDPATLPPALDDPSTAPTDLLMASLLAGDFNADGVLDVGGPDVQLSVAGTSLGGFHAVMAAALEPEVTVVTPIVAGGGLTDIMSRSTLHDVSQRIFLEVFGPLVIGCSDGQGGLWLSMNDDTDGCDPEWLASRSFAHVPGVDPQAAIQVTNLANGENASGFLNEAGGIALAVTSDRWDPLEITLQRLDGQPVVIPVSTPYEGAAFERNTPRFRRFFGISQHVLDRCDPMGFARHLFLDPLPGHPPVNVLFENALGDATVPISTGVMLAHAAGAIPAPSPGEPHPLEVLLAHGVLDGSNFDVDDLLGDNPPETPGPGPLAPVDTGQGAASIRFADVGGDHEWIAVTEPGGLGFDPGTYTQQQIAIFHASGGRVVVDDICIEDTTCPLLDDPSILWE